MDGTLTKSRLYFQDNSRFLTTTGHHYGDPALVPGPPRAAGNSNRLPAHATSLGLYRTSRPTTAPASYGRKQPLPVPTLTPTTQMKYKLLPPAIPNAWTSEFKSRFIDFAGYMKPTLTTGKTTTFHTPY